ncbi:hypothetical protein [Halocola ammonii]
MMKYRLIHLFFFFSIIAFSCKSQEGEKEDSPEIQLSQNQSKGELRNSESMVSMTIGNFKIQLTSDSIIRSFKRIDTTGYFSNYQCDFYKGDGIKYLEWETESSSLKLKVSETAKYFIETEGASTSAIAISGSTTENFDFSGTYKVELDLVDCQLRKLNFKRNKREDGPQFYYNEDGILTSSVLVLNGEPLMLTSFEGIYLWKKASDRYRKMFQDRVKVQSVFLKWSDAWERYFLSW